MTTSKPTRRFSPTPAWLIFGLLVVEGLLFLSDRVHWPTWHKGYAVLIAVASVCVVMLFMLLWFVASLLFRWRFQFSIRSLLVLTVAVAIPCSWLAVEMKAAREQKAAVEAVERADGSVIYDFQIDRAGNPTKAKVPGPAWIRKILGNGFFTSVVRVTIVCSGTDAILEKVGEFPQLRDLFVGSGESGRKITDAGLVHLRRMTQLQTLDIDRSEATDEGLEHLKGLSNLQSLCLWGTKVSNKGVKGLQQALPDCKIYSDFH